jgi:DNA-directed RNA polymerase subunit RPC12/RpoP
MGLPSSSSLATPPAHVTPMSPLGAFSAHTHAPTPPHVGLSQHMPGGMLCFSREGSNASSLGSAGFGRQGSSSSSTSEEDSVCEGLMRLKRGASTPDTTAVAAAVGGMGFAGSNGGMMSPVALGFQQQHSASSTSSPGFQQQHSASSTSSLGFQHQHSASSVTSSGSPCRAVTGSPVGSGSGSNNSSPGLDRRVTCTVCGKHLARKDTLKAHMRTHMTQKPYPCPHCDRAFTRPDRLAAHAFSHEGKNPYVCHICTKTYSRKDRLSLHLKTHDA